MSHKERATRVIALTLAEVAGQQTPGAAAWGQAKILADKFEAAGHLSEPELRKEHTMSNTHRAVIETSAPPAMQPIAAGPKDFCEHYLAKWVEAHPLGEFDTALVLAVEGA